LCHTQKRKPEPVVIKEIEYPSKILFICSVGQICGLVGWSCAFQFQLVKTKLELRLIFRTRTELLRSGPKTELFMFGTRSRTKIYVLE
jgi:hypothetical protein